jgi:hypothetical protein
MTAMFNLSAVKTLPFDFEAEVKKFVQAKKDHLTTEGESAPTAHPVVEAAVRRIRGGMDPQTGFHHPDDFVADYSIVDDTPPPTPPPTLDEMKQVLAAQVQANANALVNQIMPPLKQRIFQFQVGDALRRATAGAQTDADKAIIAESMERQDKTESIYRHVALLESQIHDLTAETIDRWKAAPFPEQ